ncbi:MAG: DinB family protein [Gemmatimonadaceae bacterium]|nr:DinB family protein [Gemmatimonadaceae bacterium]
MSLIRQLADFEQVRVALLDELESRDPRLLTARLRPDSWSQLEIVEHLAVAERVVFRSLPDHDTLVDHPRSLAHTTRALLVREILRFGIPVTVPSSEMRPTGRRSLKNIRTLWDENQGWLRAWIRSRDARALHWRVFWHPVSGPLSTHDAVALGALHLTTHLRQIRRLQTRIR